MNEKNQKPQDIEPHEMLDIGRSINIIPLHEVRDQGKVDQLIDDMIAHGWRGIPLLVYDDGNGLHAMTGTHRLAAINEIFNRVQSYDLGDYPYDSVPIVYVDTDKDLTDIFDQRDDDCRLEFFRDLGDHDATKLMELEMYYNDIFEDKKN